MDHLRPPQAGGGAPGALPHAARRVPPATAHPYRWEVAVKHDWSPDGAQIAITRQRDATGGTPDALLIRPDGKVVRRLARSAYVGGFSPDGAQLVLRLERKHGAEGRPALVGRDGSGLRALTPWTELRPRFIDWGAG